MAKLAAELWFSQVNFENNNTSLVNPLESRHDSARGFVCSFVLSEQTGQPRVTLVCLFILMLLRQIGC